MKTKKETPQKTDQLSVVYCYEHSKHHTIRGCILDIEKQGQIKELTILWNKMIFGNLCHCCAYNTKEIEKECKLLEKV